MQCYLITTGLSIVLNNLGMDEMTQVWFENVWGETVAIHWFWITKIEPNVFTKIIFVFAKKEVLYYYIKRKQMHQTAKNCLGNVIDTVFWMEKFVLLQKVGRVNTSKNTKNKTKNSKHEGNISFFQKYIFLKIG